MMLRISDLHAAYGKAEVLHGIDLEVAPGEVVCLIGRNGVGKSSTMKSIVRDQIAVTGARSSSTVPRWPGCARMR
ncbi:ATP-binding cassette domain-containing protein [Paracoccus pantotrophus]|uniref:ATP-binding cassette domain-containing protein n=1 Tax=Paracoccus pantotrophus TaxID=82367 RepID=UPI001AD6B87B|nr:ATP-binding cassette domain-containing protein [Paracoccus pantotrophus]